MIAGISQ